MVWGGVPVMTVSSEQKSDKAFLSRTRWYLRLCRLHVLCPISLTLSPYCQNRHRQCRNEQTWPCPSKNVFTKIGSWPLKIFFMVQKVYCHINSSS